MPLMRRLILTITAFLVVPTLALAEQPATHVTRAEAAMLLLSTLGEPIPERQSTYVDVITKQWYTPYVLEAVHRRIFEPNKMNGLIQPHRAVTRAELLKMMSVAFGLQTNLPSHYSDVATGAWFAPYAGIAEKHTLFPGTTNGQLQPNASVTHADAAAALITILNNYPNLRGSATAMERRAARMASKHGAAPTQGQSSSSFATTNMVKRSTVRATTRSTDVASESKGQLLNLINEERKNAGQAPLVENIFLSKAALGHARDMWDRGYFSHISPEGETFADRITESGYLEVSDAECGCTTNCICQPEYAIGENIAQGQMTPDQAVADWMNSGPHKQNILSANYNETGIGIFGNVWVQTFGKRTVKRH